MDIIIKMLDETLDYISHELTDYTLNITVIPNLEYIRCPDCSGIVTRYIHVTKKIFKTYLSEAI